MLFRAGASLCRRGFVQLAYLTLVGGFAEAPPKQHPIRITSRFYEDSYRGQRPKAQTKRKMNHETSDSKSPKRTATPMCAIKLFIKMLLLEITDRSERYKATTTRQKQVLAKSDH